MALKNTMQAITMTSIDSANFTGSYQVINNLGLTQACSIIRIINASNKDVTISYDGTTDHDYVSAGSVLQLPFQSNAQATNLVAIFPIGKKVYVKGSAGIGLVYLAGYFQPSAG